MKQVVSILVGLFLALSSIAQPYLNPQEFEYMLPNQLGVYVDGSQYGSGVQVSLHFKTGFMSEAASKDGISLLTYCYIYAAINDGVRQIPNVTMHGSIEANLTSFQFTLNNQKQLPALFGKLNQVFEKFEVDSARLANAKDMAHSLADHVQNDTLFEVENTTGPQLWGDFYSVYRPLASGNFMMEADSAEVASYQTQHYCPGYGLLMVSGQVKHREVRGLVMDSLTGWPDCRYSPANRQLLPNYQTTPVTRRNVHVEPGAAPTLLWFYQGPNLFNEFKMPFAAVALKGIWQLPGFKAQLDSMGLTGLSFDFSMEKVASQVVLKLALNDTAAIDTTIRQYHQFLDSLAVDGLISAEMLSQVKANMKEAMTATKSGDQRYELFAKYWAWSERNWIQSVADSIERLKLSDIKQLITRFLILPQHVSALVVPDSTLMAEHEDVYTSTTRDLQDYVFRFDKNTGNLDSASQTYLNSLYQFLKINPQMQVQIVGHAGKDELGQVQDGEMLDFLDTHPGFVITEKSLIPTKKIRLDVYRALVITKYLIERGIPDTQISGTGLMLSEKRTLEEDRRKVYLLRKF